MGPVTTAGAVAQAHAETLVGVALGQLVRPGSPAIYGNFLSSMALRSGSPTFGTPEPALGSLVVGQLARRVGLPLRCSGAFTSSKVPDGQAMSEVGGVDAVGVAVRRQLHPPLGRLARGWAGDGLREVHDGPRPVRCRAHLPEGLRSVRGSVRPRRLRRGRAGQALLRLAAHAAPLRDRVLRAGAQRHARRSSSGATRGERTSEDRAARCSARCSPTTRRRRSTTPSTPRCSSSSSSAKLRCPTSGTEFQKRGTP